MHPLDRAGSFHKIADMFRFAREVIVAAPYFGQGAASMLGLDRTEAFVSVVCDLLSGGCNPREIERIRQLPGKPSVKTLGGLHAKIYLTERAVLVGSANPSSNGLGFEGDELAGNIEACVHSDDPEVVRAWRKFYDEKIAALATDIHTGDLRRATILFDARRRKRERAERRTLLDEMRFRPDRLRDKPIYFTLYDRIDPSTAQSVAIEERGIALGTGKVSAYFEWAAPEFEPGAFILDFSREVGTSEIDFNGIWRVVEHDHLIHVDGGIAIFASRVADIDGMSVPPKDQKIFKSLVERNVDQTKQIASAHDMAEALVRGHIRLGSRTAESCLLTPNGSEIRCGHPS